MTESSSQSAPLSAAGQAQFDQVVERFESAWFAGDRPRIEEFLPQAPLLREAVLTELERIDLELRLKAGEPAQIDRYLEHYPELRSDQSFVDSLAAVRQPIGRIPHGRHERFRRHLPHRRRREDHVVFYRVERGARSGCRAIVVFGPVSTCEPEILGRDD